MDYRTAFADLAAIYLEDSWVVAISASASQVAFRLDAVLTPDHALYQRPGPTAQHCYRRATLTVSSSTGLMLRRSGAPPAIDASGEADFGNIDAFAPVNRDGEVAWELSGDWGDLFVVEPVVAVSFQ